MIILPRDDFVTLVLYIVVSQSTFQSFLIGRATMIDFTIKASPNLSPTHTTHFATTFLIRQVFSAFLT